MITFFSVATNIYADYWGAMVRSFEETYDLDKEVHFVCFSNRSDVQRSSSNAYVKITLVKIPDLRWPDATLERFRLMTAYLNEATVRATTVAAYIDADMLVHNANELILEMLSATGMTFVNHPGYAKFNNWKFDLGFMVEKTILLLKHSAYGAWETRPASRAYVPRKSRGVYVCGGFWFGVIDQFKIRVSTLAEEVETDKAQKMMAIWHDESHLNAHLQRDDKILSSRFCADLRNSGLAEDTVIEAVDKKGHRTR